MNNAFALLPFAMLCFIPAAQASTYSESTGQVITVSVDHNGDTTVHEESTAETQASSQ